MKRRIVHEAQFEASRPFTSVFHSNFQFLLNHLIWAKEGTLCILGLELEPLSRKGQPPY